MPCLQSAAHRLPIPPGDLILFPVSATQLKFFRAKIRPENAVGLLGTEGGALSRFKRRKYWKTCSGDRVQIEKEDSYGREV